MADALTQNVQLGAALAPLVFSLFGSGDKTTKTSGGTTTSTQQTQLSEEDVQTLIKQMLQDQSTGLAKVASGSKTPGLYNSTTQQLLVNDLISTAATKASVAAAPTTTTTTTPATTQVISSDGLLSGNSSTMLPLLAAGYLMKKDASGKSNYDTLAESLGGMFGGSGESSSDFALGGISTVDTGNALLGITGTGAAQSTTSEWSNLISNPVSNLVSELDYSGSVGSTATDSSFLSDIGSGLETAWTNLKDVFSGWF